MDNKSAASLGAPANCLANATDPNRGYITRLYFDETDESGFYYLFPSLLTTSSLTSGWPLIGSGCNSLCYQWLQASGSSGMLRRLPTSDGQTMGGGTEGWVGWVGAGRDVLTASYPSTCDLFPSFLLTHLLPVLRSCAPSSAAQ